MSAKLVGRLRTRAALGAIAALVASALLAPAAQALEDIASAGPLTHIYVGEDLRCQVDYAGDTSHEFFGGIPGSCGAFVRTSGGIAEMAPISQSGVTGSGTAGNPFRVVTVVGANIPAGTPSGLELTRTDTYVVGQDFYRSDVTVSNTNTSGSISLLLWQGADCFLQDSDLGFGFFDATTGGIYCSKTPNNSPAARIEGFVPLSGGSRFYEGPFSQALNAPFPGGFPNTCACDSEVDNGAGLSWNIDLAASASTSRSFITTFSPVGVAFDNLPPETSITGGPSGSTADTSASFSFTSEAGSTFECRLDGGAFTACTSPRSVSGLSPGAHSFEVRATDAAGNIDPTPAARAWTVAEPTLADLPKPTLGKEVNVQTLSGVVLIGVRTAAGIRFVPLTAALQIPVGSVLDTRRGKVRLQTARNRAGKRQNGDFSGGRFKVLQSTKRKDKGLTEARLTGGNFKSCQGAKKSALSADIEARASARRIRRLSGSANGRYRTGGRRSAATVRGTKWTVTDQCNGTLTKVTKGTVVVRDFGRKKNIIVRKGKSYLARNPR